MPSYPPQNVTLVNKTSTSVFIKWHAIPATQTNGEILGYKVNYTLQTKHDDRKMNDVIIVAMDYVNLTGLRKSRKYNIAVLAFNKHGDGPPSEILAVKTEEDSKFG